MALPGTSQGHTACARRPSRASESSPLCRWQHLFWEAPRQGLNSLPLKLRKPPTPGVSAVLCSHLVFKLGEIGSSANPPCQTIPRIRDLSASPDHRLLHLQPLEAVSAHRRWGGRSPSEGCIKEGRSVLCNSLELSVVVEAIATCCR